MNEVIKRAIDRANELIDDATKADEGKAGRLLELQQMTKKQLLEIVKLHEKLGREVQLGELCAKILCEPDCTWLTYDMLLSVLQNRLPGINTTVKNLMWYTSHYRNECGMDIQLRKPVKEVTRLLLKG